MKIQNFITSLVGITLTIFISTICLAEINGVDKSWKGNVELGVVNTTGNTETETINLKVKAVTERQNWKHTVSLESLTSSDQGVATAERVAVNGQSDFKLGKHDYFFAMINYENDKFSGYDYRVSETLGYGRRVIDGKTLILSLEAGPGARQSELEAGGTEDEIIVRGAAKLEWKIADSSTFTEDLSMEVGENSTITKSVAALTAQVNGSLSTKITYTIKNTSDVPVGVEKTDTETAVTLVYSF